ncbi:MAG: hypothetical protein H6873_11510 [Hyphomicrobiaceae bacterium]|nr:hypothetical protein [Hyphomicrobiaceae bacterium]
MNVGDASNLPSQRPAVPSAPLEPAHVKKQVDQQKTETSDAVAAPPRAPNTGAFVDIRA